MIEVLDILEAGHFDPTTFWMTAIILFVCFGILAPLWAHWDWMFSAGGVAMFCIMMAFIIFAVYLIIGVSM